MSNYKQNKSNWILTIGILVIFGYLILAECRPSDFYEIDSPVDPSEYNGNLSPEIIRQIQKCDHDFDTMELCMRCAKVTKSEIVYPMCCGDQENVKDWCYKYISFGS